MYKDLSARAYVGGGLEGMMLHSGDKLKTVRRRRQRIHERAIDRRRSRWATNAGRYRPARFVGCRVGQMVRWTKLLSLSLPKRDAEGRGMADGGTSRWQPIRPDLFPFFSIVIGVEHHAVPGL